MGDRANCIVLQNTNKYYPPVWLYTHGGGRDLLKLVQRAIAKRWRWRDCSYLTRIIFDTMSARQQGEECGFGISTAMGDNSHHFVVVDPKEQEVRIEDQDGTRNVLHCWTFEDFCTANLSSVIY